MMSNVAQTPSAEERKDKRRLHLREVEQGTTPPIGAVLRAARLARGEEAAAVAAKLKMRRDQLDAIEEGDYARLPGRTYTLGFIRTYARYLELDDAALIQRLKDDESAAQDQTKPVELVFPEAPEEKRIPNGSIFVIALVLAIVIYGISYLTMPARQSPTIAKASQSADLSVDPAPKPAEVASAEAPFATPDAPAAETTFVAGARLPSATLPASVAAQTATERDTLDAAALFRSATSDVVVAASPEAVPQTPTEHTNTGARIVLTALEPTYVRIKDPRRPEGKGIFIDRVLQTGESVSAPERAGLLMQTGNAGGLHVAVDGRSAGVMGKRGEVVTRIPVDPSYFLKRASASQ
ncbi:MAG: RodZ domain-containing protein [Micropepsaceae bacterium]